MINDKIEVFILTYNRCKLLEASIRSVLNQTVKTKLTVVDNHSTDDTRVLVEKIIAEGYDITFIERSINEGWPGNFKTAKNHMTFPYVMIFSDDDILHPRYIEFSLQILNREKNISLICSSHSIFGDDIPGISDCQSCTYRVFECKNDFATYLFSAQIIDPLMTPMFPNIIYSREYLIRAVELNPLFGKIADRPFFVNGAMNGRVSMICTPMLYYRVHSGSDTKFCKNPCTERNLLNYMEYFHDMAKALPNHLKAYHLVAGRNMKAIWNFSYRNVSIFLLFFHLWKKDLTRLISLPMLFERVLHLFGVKRIGYFEMLAFKQIETMYKEKNI